MKIYFFSISLEEFKGRLNQVFQPNEQCLTNFDKSYQGYPVYPIWLTPQTIPLHLDATYSLTTTSNNYFATINNINLQNNHNWLWNNIICMVYRPSRNWASFRRGKLSQHLYDFFSNFLRDEGRRRDKLERRETSPSIWKPGRNLSLSLKV